MLKKFRIIGSFQKKLTWIIASLILAIFADNWFWGSSPRLGWFVWCILFITARYCIEIYTTKTIQRTGLFTGISVFCLSFFVYLRSSDLLTIINIGITIHLLFIMWRGYTPTSSHNPFFSNLVVEPLSTWIRGIESGFKEIGIFKPKSAIKSNITGAVIRGVFITFPIIGVFSVLLSLSDTNFAQILGDTIMSFTRYFSFVGLVRLGFILGTTILIYGLGFILKSNKESKKEPTVSKSNEVINWESVILFSSIILLFGSYIILQASYLIGGKSFIAKIDGTYAEFAKRGFFELSIITILIFGIVLTTDYIINKTRIKSKIFSALAAIIITQTFILLLSAWSKLALYIQGYGYTNLRLYTQVWIICMGLSFILLFVRELNFLKPNIFSNGVFVIFLSGLIVLNIINPEYTIAKYNLSQTNWNISEIGNYGYDAYPAINQLLQDPFTQTRIDSASYCSLKSKSTFLQNYKRNATWNQRNIGLDRAQESLSKVRFIDRSLAC
jgi:hypothetical protein